MTSECALANPTRMTTTLSILALALATLGCDGPQEERVGSGPRAEPPPARELRVEPQSTPAANPPAAPPPAAPPATPPAAPSASTIVPPVLIDCATSAMSARRLAELKVPYYPWFGQSPDPESLKTGTINVSILLDEIRKKMGANPTGWGMLDYEDPFDAWLDLPVTDPRNRKASAEMVRAIKAVKAEFPNVKWTYYGQPRMARQFPSGKSWVNGTAQERQAEIDRRIASLSDILREVDWISPSIYDVYENALFHGEERDFMLANETMWREQVVRLARTIRERTGRPQVPVIPTVNLFFFENGRGTNMAPIPIEEVLQDQVDPALRGGVDAFAIWTSMDFFQMLASLPDDKELSALNRQNQTAARSAWTKAFFGGRKPADWTDPQVKFSISQATGKVIMDGAEAVQRRVLEHRSASAPAAK